MGWGSEKKEAIYLHSLTGSGLGSVPIANSTMRSTSYWLIRSIYSKTDSKPHVVATE